jgi:hypothetical protein
MNSGCSARDCCIDVFERAGCEHIPHETLESDSKGYSAFSDYLCTPCQIIFILLSGRVWSGGFSMRLFNWFFHPFEAFLGMCAVCNTRHAHALKSHSQSWFIEPLCSFFLCNVGFAYSVVCSIVSLFACLPCFMCFSLSQCIRKRRGSLNDALFWIIYTPLLFMAMSGRYIWRTLCCRRSCFGCSRGPCGPSCTLTHKTLAGAGDCTDQGVCVLCGRSAAEHSGLSFHTCRDGRRGSFLWTGPKHEDAFEHA